MSDRVLLTGASGFIAKHIAVKLLDAGFAVRGTLRHLDRASEVRAAVEPHVVDRADLDGRLTFSAADLEDDAGWDEAMDGVGALVHTASPFPLAPPADDSVLIRPAVEGTRRVLGAARSAGVSRIVLTSSYVAVTARARPEHGDRFDERDWADLDHPIANAYVRSKALAERAAWDLVGEDGASSLTVINPGFVLGPPLDGHTGASVSLVARLLAGKDLAQPRLGLPVVDVRDVAEAHLRALQRPASGGRRYLAIDRWMWMTEMAAALRRTYADRRIATRTAPTPIVRLLALFDAEIRATMPRLGRREEIANDRARTELGMTFIPAEEALLATAADLVARGAV